MEGKASDSCKPSILQHVNIFFSEYIQRTCIRNGHSKTFLTMQRCDNFTQATTDSTPRIRYNLNAFTSESLIIHFRIREKNLQNTLCKRLSSSGQGKENVPQIG